MLLSFSKFSIAVLFSLICGMSFAQPSPSDYIDVNNYDQKYLEHLTKIKIDSIRKANGLNALINDSILQVAACDHVTYMNEKNSNGHAQENPLKKSAQDRVIFYGGTDYLADENVHRTLIHKKVKRKPIIDSKGRKIPQSPTTYDTYEHVATAIATTWSSNPKILAKILKPHWQISGLCIVINSETSTVRTVQKYGYIPLKYHFTENKDMFPYSEYVAPEPINSFSHHLVRAVPYQRKLPYKVKAPKRMTRKIQEFRSLVEGGMFLRGRRGNTFTLSMFKPEIFQKVFKKKKNGVALEIVEYLPYACGNVDYYLEQSRRNGKSVLKGRILEPVYKKELLEGFDPENDEMQNADIGVDPKDYTTIPEFNLLFLYKKKVAYVMHFVGACGSPYELYKKQPLLSRFDEGELEFETFPDSATIIVDFKRNQTTLDSSEFQAIRDSVPREQISIHKVIINAFSSVEGTEAINLNLMQKRANHMEAAMRPYLNDSTEITKNAKENWDLFYEQTKTGRFKKLGTYSKEKIKAMLSDTVKRKVLDKLLFQQRIAQIKLYYTSTVKDSAQYILDYYTALVNNMKYRKKASGEEVEMLNWCHDFLYKQFKAGNMDTATFINMPIPQYEELYQLQGNHAWAQYQLLEADSNKEPSSGFIELLLNSGTSRYTEGIYQVNMLNYFIDKWTEQRLARGSLSPLQMLEVIDSLKADNDPRIDLTQMLLNFHFKAAYYFYQESDFNNRDKSAMYIFQHYGSKQLSDSTALRLGRAFTNLGRGDLGSAILRPYALRPDPNHDILALYLKLSYTPVDIRLDENYFKFLISTYNTFGQERWCKLFLTECSISFQAFDYKPLRDFYCEQCAATDNEATKHIKDAMKKGK